MPGRGRRDECPHAPTVGTRLCGVLGAAASHLALAVGIGCALFRWHLATTVVLAGLFALVGIAFAGIGSSGFLPVLRRGVIFGLAVTALVGAVAALGVLGLVVALPLLFTQPAVNAVVRSYWRDKLEDQRGFLGEPGHDAVPSPETVGPLRQPGALDLLDDAALCRSWRQSFLHVTSTTSLERRLELAEHRRLCLDELQRRNPDGFAAWLASGARAASDPLPFLRKAHPPSV